ncbi:MAG: PA domain-containing protein [Acidobacteriota bacterium]
MFSKGLLLGFFALAIPLLLVVLWVPEVQAGATVVVINGDRANEGFNDRTPAPATGGNTGLTVGEQRLIAFQHAANIWGATLDTNVTVKVQATFDPLPCSASSGVLGAAGTFFVIRDFSASAFPATWYHSALADKIVGSDLVPGAPDIVAFFNASLGSPGCLESSGWYYGLDNLAPSNRIDLIAVALHELGHGLGFANFVDESSGRNLAGFTDIYSRFTQDLSSGKTWDVMSDAERMASAINVRKVVWNGTQVTTALPTVLSPGTPFLQVNAPASITGRYPVGTAVFGPPLSSPGITADLALALDGGPVMTDGCSPLSNAAAVAGKIALIDRGTCTFTQKVLNAQSAGAVAVIVVDNVPGSPPPGLGGAAAGITIPAVRVSLADGALLKNQLSGGTPVNVTLGVDLTQFAGADPTAHALLFTPNPVQPGSSLSHWDPIASPNQLMEPAINSDLTHSVKAPQDLTLALLRDVGWTANPTPDLCPISIATPSVIIDGYDTRVPNILFSTGCTLSDFVQLIAANSRNHGDFESSVAGLVNTLRQAGLISEDQSGELKSAAARANLP